MSYRNKWIIALIVIFIFTGVWFLFNPNRQQGIIIRKLIPHVSAGMDSTYVFVLYDTTKGDTNTTMISDKLYWQYKTGEWFSNKVFK